MRIEFDPTNPTEAAAVRAMLTALTPRPTASIVMHEAPTDDAWHNGTTYTPSNEPQPITIPNVDQPTTIDGAAQTDSTGTPWDERIHSTPATTNKDGTWRAKRGVTAEQVAQVKAEREQTTITATDGAGMTVTENLETGERTVSVEAEQFVVSAPPAPPAPPVTKADESAPPAPPVKLAEETVVQHVAEVSAMVAPSFLDVMKAITAAQKDGKIDTPKVKELCAAVGAGESTMGLNGPDNGDKRHVFLIVLNLDAEPRDAIIAEAMKEKEPSARLDLIKAMLS